jgi:hypothetical protein
MFGFIGALVGGAIGVASSIFGGNKQAAAYERQKDNAWQRYLINKEFADTQFALNKNESLTSLNIQQRRLGEDLSAGVDSYNTGLLGQAYGIQDAQIGLASQLGAFDAAQGASGTRGNEASGLVKAYAQTSFDRNLALQREQNDQALSGMTTQATRAGADIQRERNSWGAGGYRTQLYNAEDERNRKLAELGQQELQYAADQARPGFFDTLLGGLSGASSGLSFGANLTETLKFSGSNADSAYSSVLTNGAAPFNLGSPLGLPAPYVQQKPYDFNFVNKFNSLGGMING